MKDADLIAAGFQSTNLEPAERIAHHTLLSAVDDHLCVTQIRAVQTVDQYSGDFRRSRFRARVGRHRVLRRILFDGQFFLGFFPAEYGLALLSADGSCAEGDSQ